MKISATPSRLLVVMAGFFSDDSIPETTKIWVRALQNISMRMVIVFDNQEPLDVPDSWQNESCMALFDRHAEYDFGSYKRGLQWAEQRGWLSEASHVLFCNDSIYGPISELQTTIKPMVAQSNEAWGLTASNQITPHLQSFFLLLGRSILEKPAIRNLFNSIKRQPHRQAVIDNYEIGLSKALLSEGISFKALLDIDRCCMSYEGERMINPTAWPCSAMELGMPVLKKKALHDELANQEGFSETCRAVAIRNPKLWQSIIAESPYWRLWCSHLKIGIIWRSNNFDLLEEQLNILRAHLNCNWSVLLPLDLRSRSELSLKLLKAINNGELKLTRPALETDSVLEPILSSDHDWITIASSKILDQPHRWVLILRQLIYHPERNIISGDPVVVRRHWWLQQGAHMKTIQEHHFEPVQISPNSID
tara:strand:+ start:34 stop:1296 length:1263 start_codon:yes stop_codon:yes gene_type:complete